MINKSISKKDSMSLVTGKPVYTEDIAPKNLLVVKFLKSPHPFARVISINKEVAMKIEGMEAIYTHEDVPKNRFTLAGQSYPEPSPYDRLILDEYVRYVGDFVCIVVGSNEECVDKALRLIKVKYEIFDSIIDLSEALDNKVVIHPEDNYHTNFEIGNQVKRNLCASGTDTHGDLEEAFSNSDIILEREYHTKANNQAMMEPFKTFVEIDYQGRYVITSATQIPFHVRRIVSNALGIPKSKIKVIKPRIGGGFGAKQTAVSEVYAAFVTYKTGKGCRLFFSRQDCFVCGSSRHEMKIKVKIGSKNNGEIQAIQISTLSNTGAYGEHASTTVGLTAKKTIPLYNKVKAFKFDYKVVYTNTMSAGAFRGYGATQGTFAMESIVNELAKEINMDPIELRLKNIVSEGEVMPGYYNEKLNSCKLKECILKGKEKIGWDKKYPSYKVSEDKIRSLGMAISMQGSGISNIDIGTAKLILNDGGFYTLMTGSTDMGTGSDTILAQMVSESLLCDVDNVIVHGVDTDISPYDTGSYASSTTYITGGAIVKVCEKMKEKLLEEAKKHLNENIEDITFDGVSFKTNNNKELTLVELANKLNSGHSEFLTVSASNSSPVSPPPFMAGFVEIETDIQTGEVKIIDYVGVVDCGTIINPNLARVQVEGGIVQGIGMALLEDVNYSKSGKMSNNSFMRYKIPSRLDVENIRVFFQSSYEPTGPFGAKSIGEVVINTSSPAIAHAIYNATGKRFVELPIKSEDIALGITKE